MKRITLTTIAIAFFTVGGAIAQDMPEPVDATALAQQITGQATDFSTEVERLAARLAALPEDMTGAVDLYDEMIASIDEMLVKVGPDTQMAGDIANLKVMAEEKREEWRKVCSETNNPDDCKRVDLWDEKVGEAIAKEDEFNGLVQTMTDARGTISDNRKYLVDDLQLEIFASALEKVGEALERMRALKDNMVALAQQVGGPDFNPDETE